MKGAFSICNSMRVVAAVIKILTLKGEGTEHSSCTTPIDVSSLPYEAEDDTLNSKPVWAACEESNKQGNSLLIIIFFKYSGIWYRIQGSGNKVIAHTCNAQTDFDTMIEVYSSCSSSSSDSDDSCITYNDDYSGSSGSCGLASLVSWSTDAGTYYWIFVTGRSYLSMG